MRTKTELFLYMLSWRSGQLLSPTSHHLHQSFEGWAYQNGFLPQIEKLKAQGFLKNHPDARDVNCFIQLTREGELAAQGGVNPEKAWARKWNQTWHLILFDLPAHERTLRKEFLRALKANGFGCLQGSVWVSPRFPKTMKKYLNTHPTRPCRLVHLKSFSEGKEQDRRLVWDAWNFNRIHQDYLNLLQILNEFQQIENASQLLNWAQREWRAWKTICEKDPMLPKALHPADYPGPEIWHKRKKVLKQAGLLASGLFVSPETNKS
ncbi:PaaX family transcriptional regulator C-terminal domain-containing protein [Kiritimatiellota bacterium B12222]|nr:PaaX family transcriptional regulator C-terminal domain-containing protein [Kiritimatiellota bacterium B12222]